MDMKQKRLMLLGGLRYLLPVIKRAHELGLYVITCDYLPENIAHKYSDEYVNVSIIDKEAVLTVAQEKQIDGITSFACDPGVTTAAYVAEKMDLPFQGSYESVSILQDKGKFRQFLIDHGFNCPHAKSYTNVKDPFNDIDYFTWPVIVKPVDSAGSKGVTRVEKPEDLPEAIQTALDNGHNGKFIIEDFLSFESYHSSTDPFTVDGKLKYITFSDQLFDKYADNPYTPAFIIWPTTMKQVHQDYLVSEIQRLMDLLHMRTGLFNIETVVGKGGIPYIMEVSPRGGGCKIAELQEMSLGVNVIENEIRKAVGMPLLPIEKKNIAGNWCEMIIHARPGQEGVFEQMNIRDDVKQKNVRVIDMSTTPGDYVYPFTGANMALGDMILHFETRDELDETIADTTKWLDIILK